jgi:N-acetylmuramoyl-L-alanine amidase
VQVYRRGDSGPAIAEIRDKLTRLGLLEPSGTVAADSYDDALDRAVRSFQQRRGLRIDGVVGAETYRALDEARWRLGDRTLSHTVNHPYVGDDVVGLQQRLLDLGFDPGRCDGIFGIRTAAALRDFQRNVGLAPDGILGPTTLAALGRLRRTVTGGSPSAQREEEQLRRGSGSLSGRVVVLDPGHGGDDLGACAHELAEAEVALDLATRIEGRLGALGVDTFLTRGEATSPTDEERARFANETEADLLLSLHTDAALSAGPRGVASYYYGTGPEAGPPPSGTQPSRDPQSPRDTDGVVRSAVGERLAQLVQNEIVARTDLLDCRIHPKTWQLLRMTRMPAVRIDVGYVTNARDAARLGTAEFRDAVAEAVVAAVQRLYLPPDRDIATGQFRMPALAR